MTSPPQTVQDVLTGQPVVSVKLWRCSDGVWCAMPEYGPYPRPGEWQADLSHVPVVDGDDPLAVVAQLLACPAVYEP